MNVNKTNKNQFETLHAFNLSNVFDVRKINKYDSYIKLTYNFKQLPPTLIYNIKKNQLLIGFNNKWYNGGLKLLYKLAQKEII